jgi:hypothetical protein
MTTNEWPETASQSISSGAQYVTLSCCANTFHIQLLIANHLDQSLWSTNQKHWAAVKSYLLHSFLLQVHTVVAPFTSHRKLCNYAKSKLFSSTKPACFDFSLSNFTLHDHIWSTAGDALGQGGDSKESFVSELQCYKNRCCIGFQSSSSKCDKIARLLHRDCVNSCSVGWGESQGLSQAVERIRVSVLGLGLKPWFLPLSEWKVYKKNCAISANVIPHSTTWSPSFFLTS